MKKSILLMAVVCVAALCTAQQRMEVKKNLDSRTIGDAFVREASYLGQYNGLYCFLGKEKRQRMKLVMVDHNMEPLRVMELPESSVNCRLLAGSVSGNRLGLLLVDNDERSRAIIYTACFDLDSLRPADGGPGLVMTDSLTFGRKDRCMVWGATSPGARRNAMVVIVEYTESKKYSAHAVLYDALMKEEWHYDYAMGSMNDLHVTDDGTIVTLGYEPENEETHFVFNIMDGGRADTYDAVIKCDPIRELRLAGVVGSHVMAVGLFNTASYHSDDMCGGVVALSFDKDSALLTGFTMRPFQNEDINILYNKPTRKIQRDQEVELMSMVGSVMTPGGAVVAVGRNYGAEHVEDNGSISKTYHRVGLHLLAVDTLGRVGWVRNLRRNDMQKGDDGLLGVGLMHAYGRTYILKSENRKSPASYEISRESREYKAGTKSNLVVYSIGADGEVEKAVLEQKTPYGFVRAVRRDDGVMALFTQDGRRSRIVELKL